MADQQEDLNVIDEPPYEMDRLEPAQIAENLISIDDQQQKQEEKEEEEEMVAPSASLDGLHTYCLELILKQLDLESLLNVAGTCKRLQVEAISVASMKIGAEEVTLYHNHNISSSIGFREDATNTINGLAQCLAFLRCFGAHISNLYDAWIPLRKYNNMPRYKCCTVLDQYINEYCADSLDTITFENKAAFPTKKLKKAFTKVQTVGLISCGVANTLPCFTNWFPNLRCLKIYATCKIQLSDDLQLYFPHLQQLAFPMMDGDEYKLGAKNLLRMNPQLQTLQIDCNSCMTVTDLLDVISENATIVDLNISNLKTDDNWVCKAHIVSAHLARNHPLLISLDLDEWGLACFGAMYLISHLEQLKEFRTNNHREYLSSRLNSEWEEIGEISGKCRFVKR